MEKLKIESPEAEGFYNWDSFRYPMQSLAAGDGQWRFANLPGEDPIDSDRLIQLVTSLDYDRVYYARSGYRDGDDWVCVVKKDDLYIYFEAGCDYTGFDCRGGGTITYSKSSDNMWLLGLDDKMRDLLERNNTD